MHLKLKKTLLLRRRKLGDIETVSIPTKENERHHEVAGWLLKIKWRQFRGNKFTRRTSCDDDEVNIMTLQVGKC